MTANEVLQCSGYLRLLHDFSGLPKKAVKPTFLQIAGFPHYENVCSNLLKFFFNPQAEHGLDGLLLRSLFGALGMHDLRDQRYTEASVDREVVTYKGNRLDLLLTLPGTVIGIENKIHAAIYNDLDDYSSFLESTARMKSSQCHKIVLTLRKPSAADMGRIARVGFESLTYDRFFEEIRKLLGEYRDNEIKYSILLDDFIRSIESIEGRILENHMMWNFFRANGESIKDFNVEYEKFLEHLRGKVLEIQGNVSPLSPQTVGAIYEENCVYFDIVASGARYTIQAGFNQAADRWEIAFFIKGRASETAIAVGRAVADALKQSIKTFNDANWSAASVVDFSFNLASPTDLVAQRLEQAVHIVERKLRISDGEPKLGGRDS